MTTNDARPEPVRMWPAALASLLPWLALLVTSALAEDGVGVDDVDDGQAGFAVVNVPMVAFPLVGVVRACQVVEARLRPERPEGR